MKNILKFLIRLTITVVTSIILSSCPDSSNSDLSVQTINWESDGTNRQFYTNDSQYYDYSFSSTDISTYYDLQTTTLTAYLKKNSGSTNYGYGLIFGKQNTSAANYYRMNVTPDGWIQVYKRVDDVTTIIISWTEMSSSIGFNTGYGVENKVEIWESSSVDDKFWIAFNDSTTAYYFNDTGTVFNTGYVGMAASVGSSSYESFPNTPVDVRIRITSPVTMRSVGGSMDSSIELANPDEVMKY